MFKPKTVLEMLTIAVGSYYAKDPSRAGIVLSSLDGGGAYASIVRYRAPYGEQKYVEVSARGEDLGGAVVQLARLWTERTSQGAHLVGRLAQIVRSKT